jgi:hypothetical protein
LRACGIRGPWPSGLRRPASAARRS